MEGSKKLSGTSVLITGVAGNIGSSFAQKLIDEGCCRVVGVDNLITGSRLKLPSSKSENFDFIEADVNNFESIKSIFENENFDYVFHFAALVGVKRTIDNPLMVLNDINGIRNILTLSVENKIKRFFYSSSSEVYGEPVEIPQIEDTTPLNARLPYAVVKNIGEVFVRTYQKEFGLNYTIFRFFNTYGPNQSDDFVISKFIKFALAGEHIPIYGDGSQTRTFCYIDDNVDTMYGCMKYDLFINDTLNIGSDKEMRIGELANLIIKLTTSKSRIQYLPKLPEGDMTRRKPSIEKMKLVLRRPILSLEEGLLRVIEKSKFKYQDQSILDRSLN
jgi:UDP-glucuronate decarboxylase